MQTAVVMLGISALLGAFGIGQLAPVGQGAGEVGVPQGGGLGDQQGLVSLEARCRGRGAGRAKEPGMGLANVTSEPRPLHRRHAAKGPAQVRPEVLRGIESNSHTAPSG